MTGPIMTGIVTTGPVRKCQDLSSQPAGVANPKVHIMFLFVPSSAGRARLFEPWTGKAGRTAPQYAYFTEQPYWRVTGSLTLFPAAISLSAAVT